MFNCTFFCVFCLTVLYSIVQCCSENRPSHVDMCFDHIYSGTLVRSSNFAAKTMVNYPCLIQHNWHCVSIADPDADFPMGASALGFPCQSRCGFSHGRQRPRISSDCIPRNPRHEFLFHWLCALPESDIHFFRMWCDAYLGEKSIKSASMVDSDDDVALFSGNRVKTTAPQPLRRCCYFSRKRVKTSVPKPISVPKQTSLEKALASVRAGAGRLHLIGLTIEADMDRKLADLLVFVQEHPYVFSVELQVLS